MRPLPLIMDLRLRGWRDIKMGGMNWVVLVVVHRPSGNKYSRSNLFDKGDLTRRY